MTTVTWTGSLDEWYAITELVDRGIEDFEYITGEDDGDYDEDDVTAGSWKGGDHVTQNTKPFKWWRPWRRCHFKWWGAAGPRFNVYYCENESLRGHLFCPAHIDTK